MRNGSAAGKTKPSDSSKNREGSGTRDDWMVVGKAPMADTEKGVFPPWAKEPLKQFLESIRSTREFYLLTIDGLRMIIHHHKFLVISDARIKELNSSLLELGGEPEETEKAQEISRAQDREQA